MLFAVAILLRAKAQLTVSAGPQLFTYDLVKEYPHDPNAFTQGIEFDRNGALEFFWESTGKQTNQTLCLPTYQGATKCNSCACKSATIGICSTTSLFMPSTYLH